MAVDLNGLVSKFLTPQLVSQIASTAGVDPDSAQKLISAAIPAVLASLAGALAAPGGAKTVYDAVSNADPDTLGKLTAALGAGQLQTLNDGAKALGRLVGADRLSKLANALGDHAGVPPEAAQSALGTVSQAIIGVIGQQDPSTWSDAKAIANLFAGQKSAIAAALPSALSHLLGAAATATTSAAASAAPAGAPTTAGGSGLPMWAIVVVVVVLAAIAYWFLIHKKAEKPAAGMAPATIEFVMRAGDARVG
jgi:hypothetical protein